MRLSGVALFESLIHIKIIEFGLDAPFAQARS